MSAVKQEPRISRAKLIRVAEESIREARETVHVPDELAEDVMEVARTVERVTMDSADWYENPSCGCLIGTLRMRKGEDPNPSKDDDREEMIGLAFYNLLFHDPAFGDVRSYEPIRVED